VNGENTVGFVVAVIVGLMLAETRVSRRHEAALRARGASTPPGDVYGLLAVLYPMSFLLMGLEGAWRAASAASARAGPPGPSWFAAGLLLFVASKALKYWAVRELGERWTFRVFIVPWLPLVTTGPYRYVAHPNYVGVVGELVGAAMMVGAEVTGPIMIGVFSVALWARVRFERRVIDEMAPPPAASSGGRP
jgi:methyltransferase